MTMRVLMLSSLWPPAGVGGAELYAAALAERLAETGNDVGVVTLGVRGPRVLAAVQAWPYRLDAFQGQSLLRRVLFHGRDLTAGAPAAAVRRVIAEWRPDVVHSHVVTGMSARVLAVPARLRVPHVHTLHDYWLLCVRSGLIRREGRICEHDCRKCTVVSALRRVGVRNGGPHLVVAPSRAVAEEHLSRGWFRGRVRVIPHPVDPKPTEQRRPRGTRASVRFGFLGALTVEKGIPQLLEAFAHVRRQLSAEMLVAGTGPLAPRVEGAGIRYLGWLDATEKQRFWNAIDCLVVPSVWREPAPLVVNEAAERGVPVIASAVGGIPEMVADSCRELLIPPGDVMALVEAMLRFANGPGRFQPAARSHPTWREHLAMILQAYHEASSIAGGPV